MTKRRCLALALALLMALPLIFSGCSQPGENKGQETGGVEATEESSVYDAEYHDLDGHTFYFVVGNTTQNLHLAVNEVYAEAVNGEKVNDAVFQRNEALKAKFHCDIQEERLKDAASAVKEQLLAGEYTFDFIYYGVKELRRLSAAGLLVDFKQLEDIDLSKSWWDQNAIDGFSIGGKVFYVTGAAGTLDERASWIVYFNKDIIEVNELQNPYELAKDGKWTVDKMVEYMNATWYDMDGNGVMEIGKDRFGYIGEALNNWFHVAACNVHLSRMNSAGEIEIPPTVNKDLLEVWNSLKPLLTSQYREVSDEGPRFRQGLATFFACNLGAVTNMAGSTVNFGLLPMPKLNEEQKEYWTSVNGGWCYVYAIPTVVDNGTDYEAHGFASGREQAAYFLEAFSYYSMGRLDVAYYDQVVKYQIAQDEDSGKMLDLAMKNKLYDPVVLFDFGGIGTTLFKEVGSNGGRVAGSGAAVPGSDANYDTLVSTYTSRLDAARKQLKNYLEYISYDT